MTICNIKLSLINKKNKKKEKKERKNKQTNETNKKTTPNIYLVPGVGLKIVCKER